MPLTEMFDPYICIFFSLFFSLDDLLVNGKLRQNRHFSRFDPQRKQDILRQSPRVACVPRVRTILFSLLDEPDPVEFPQPSDDDAGIAAEMIGDVYGFNVIRPIRYHKVQYLLSPDRHTMKGYVPEQVHIVPCDERMLARHGDPAGQAPDLLCDARCDFPVGYVGFVCVWIFRRRVPRLGDEQAQPRDLGGKGTRYGGRFGYGVSENVKSCAGQCRLLGRHVHVHLRPLAPLKFLRLSYLGHPVIQESLAERRQNVLMFVDSVGNARDQAKFARVRFPGTGSITGIIPPIVDASELSADFGQRLTSAAEQGREIFNQKRLAENVWQQRGIFARLPFHAGNQRPRGDSIYDKDLFRVTRYGFEKFIFASGRRANEVDPHGFGVQPKSEEHTEHHVDVTVASNDEVPMIDALQPGEPCQTLRCIGEPSGLVSGGFGIVVRTTDHSSLAKIGVGATTALRGRLATAIDPNS